MTYCCDNIKKAYDLILNARSTLDWSQDISESDRFFAGLTFGISSNIKQSGDISTAQDRMSRARRDLGDAQDLINSCSCGDNYAKLNIKYNDLFRENEGNKRENRNLGSQITSERVKNAQNEATLKQERDNANSNNATLTLQLQDKDNQLTQKNNEIRRIEGDSTNLRIELTQKNNQLSEKERELKLKEEEIKLLRNEKGLTQEELLTEKLHFEKNNLELFSARLGISLEQINNLSKSHERLFVDRKTRNQTNIDLHETNIAQVKQNFLSWGFDIIDIGEICQKCERIAQLSWELTQIQQQYQARQEVPTN